MSSTRCWIKRTLTVRKNTTKFSKICILSYLKDRIKTSTGRRISAGEATIISIKDQPGAEHLVSSAFCTATGTGGSWTQGTSQLLLPSSQPEQEPVDSKSSWQRRSGSLSSAKMAIPTSPCLSFCCLSLSILPLLHPFPSSCLLVSFVPLFHPSTSPYPFICPAVKVKLQLTDYN